MPVPARTWLAACALVLAATLALIAAGPVPSAGASACSPASSTAAEDLAPKEARTAIVCLLNQQRDDAGLKSLDSNRKLQRAAQRHTERMDGTGCFDHECAGEADLGRRLESVGYLGGGLTRWTYGENIAWGGGERGTPRAIVGAWMDSPPHRASILSRDFRDIGVGFAPGTPHGDRASGGIYTTDFGLRVR